MCRSFEPLGEDPDSWKDDVDPQNLPLFDTETYTASLLFKKKDSPSFFEDHETRLLSRRRPRN